ncbi:MAG: hypothetical protein VKI42_10020 [Synechococcaceae cyanobacterium]|nr:hypothetical protein [Synechococcaceae cyanobacterium]
MNLIGLMIAVAMMSVGALTSAYFLIDPPLALSRLSAQAQADLIVETLRQASWKGQKIRLVKDASGKITGVTVDGNDLTIPSNCTVSQPLGSMSSTQYVSVSCAGGETDRDKRQALYRSSQTALIGGNPCDSDLFPTPPLSKPTDPDYLCTEWNNTPPPPENKDPMAAGHFDLDTYSGFSTKGLHVHRWDDKNIAYISSSAPGLFDLMRSGDTTPCGPGSSIPVCAPLGVPRAIPEVLAISQPFYLLISNGTLSPMMQIRFRYTDSAGVQSPEITCTEDPKVTDARPFDKCFVLSTTSTGGTPLTAIPFINIPSTSLPPAASPPPASSPAYYRLDYLYVGFSQADPHFSGGLIPTATGQVNGTRSTPGVCGEYRNGAFVIQAVSDIPSTLYRITSSTPNPTPDVPFSCGGKYSKTLDTIQNASTPATKADISGTPFAFGGNNYISNGGTGLAVSNVIYEMSVFWHANSGYSASMSPMFYPFDKTSVALYINR